MGWHGTHMVGWLERRGEKQNHPEPPVYALLLFVFYLKKWLEFILLPGKAASLYDDKIAQFTRKFIYIGFERQTLQWQTPAKTWACCLSHFPCCSAEVLTLNSDKFLQKDGLRANIRTNTPSLGNRVFRRVWAEDPDEQVGRCLLLLLWTKSTHLQG